MHPTQLKIYHQCILATKNWDANYSPPHSPLEYVTEEEAKDDEGMSPKAEHKE